MKMLNKELKLASSPLTYFFISGALLSFMPGYPILVGVFFTTLGIFYSFQSMRENNDIGYSLLLPVAKRDIVKGKFCFVLLIELLSFVVLVIVTVLRMTLLKELTVYTENALMSANFVFLGFSLLVYGLFNYCFLSGFFKTAYYFGKPFVIYCISALIVIGTAETLHHIPKLEKLNSFGFENMTLQLTFFLCGICLFVLLTALSLKKSIKMFEKIDL